MRKVGETLAIAAASFGILTGDTSAMPVAEREAAAREAIAQRYDSCEIRNVIDRQEAERRKGADRELRNHLTITLATDKTDDSRRYEAVYTDDSQVNWDGPYPEGFIDMGEKNDRASEHGLGLPVIGTPFGHPTDAPSVRFPLYPRTDYEPDTQMHVYVFNNTETTDFDNRKQYQSKGAVYCGTLTLSHMSNDGQLQWQNSEPAPGRSDLYVERVCDLVSTSSDGSSYSVECPDWQTKE